MALPCGTTGSLCSSFLPDRLVCLPVKHPYAITLCDRLPIGLRVPLVLRYAFGGDHPSQTTHHTVSPHPAGSRIQTIKGSYFNDELATNTGVPASKPPTYPTHQVPEFNVKL